MMTTFEEDLRERVHAALDDREELELFRKRAWLQGEPLHRWWSTGQRTYIIPDQGWPEGIDEVAFLRRTLVPDVAKRRDEDFDAEAFAEHESNPGPSAGEELRKTIAEG